MNVGDTVIITHGGHNIPSSMKSEWVNKTFTKHEYLNNTYLGAYNFDRGSHWWRNKLFTVIEIVDADRNREVALIRIYDDFYKDLDLVLETRGLKVVHKPLINEDEFQI